MTKLNEFLICLNLFACVINVGIYLISTRSCCWLNLVCACANALMVIWLLIGMDGEEKFKNVLTS